MSTSVPSTDVMITAPRTRAAMQSSTTPGRAWAGTATTARLTSPGTSWRRGHERLPPTVSWAGLTGNTATLSADVTLRHTAAPTEPGSSLAPTTAIVRGRRSRAIARESARCSRRSTESRNSAVSSSEKSRSTTPLSKRRSTGQPARLNTASIGRLSASTSAVNRCDPVRAGDGGEVLEQEGGDALALVLVVDLERSVGVVAAGPALVARPGDELAEALDDQRGPIDEVDDGEVLEVGTGERRLRREVAAVPALRRLTGVEGGQGRRVGRVGSAGRAPSRRCRGRPCSTTAPRASGRSPLVEVDLHDPPGRGGASAAVGRRRVPAVANGSGAGRPRRGR